LKKILTKITAQKSIFVFDFDGVIVDSMISKGSSFANIFNVDYQLKRQIINYHLKNGSKSRFDKIKYITKYILKSNNGSYDEKYILKKISDFKKNYLKNIDSIKLVKGIDCFLKYINKIDNKIYIVSAAPRLEIEFFLKKFKLSSFISYIYDSKISKSDAMNKIININKTSNEKYIYFGDSISDWDVCQDIKIDFCAVLSNKKSNLHKKKSFSKINDFL